MLRGEPGNRELKHGEMLLVVATGTDRDVVQGPNGSFQEGPHGTSQDMPVYKQDLMEALREGPPLEEGPYGALQEGLHCKRDLIRHCKRGPIARGTLWGHCKRYFIAKGSPLQKGPHCKRTPWGFARGSPLQEGPYRTLQEGPR